MRLAVIVRNAGGAGSVSRVAQQQSRELARTDEVDLVSESRGVEAQLKYVQIQPLKFGFLGPLAHVPNELAFAYAARRVLPHLAPLEFVICHSHVVAVLSALHHKRKFGVRFGIVTHGDIFDRPPGTYDPRLTALYRWATPIAYREADLVVALSPAMALRAIERGARESAVEVIPNGVAPREIGLSEPREPSRNHGEQLRVLYVGRLAREKGVADLIEACRDLDVALTIAGRGPLEDELRAAASGARVDFVGAVPRERLAALYVTHDVTCVPSLSEPFGLVVVESLMCGTPVVGTRVGGIPSIVEDDVNGLLVPPADATALRGALRSLIDDRSRLEGLGRAAAPSVVERFAWPAIGRRLRAAIAERLRSPR